MRAPAVGKVRPVGFGWGGLNPRALVLAGLAESLQLFAAAALAGLLIIGLAAHLLAEPASLAKFAEPTNSLLNRLTGANP